MTEVYVTEGGERFHRSADCYHLERGNAVIPERESDVKDDGLRECNCCGDGSLGQRKTWGRD